MKPGCLNHGSSARKNKGFLKDSSPAKSWDFECLAGDKGERWTIKTLKLNFTYVNLDRIFFFNGRD